MPSDNPTNHPAIGNSGDAKAFRKALGSFATGVTIATTLDAEDRTVGVTASSFNSVSLDPPLVLWSLSKTSLSRPAFSKSGHFAIHVLTSDQTELADRFARSQTDKWDGLKWHAGTLGSPLLDNHAAVFECRLAHEYDGGDHVILVGEVVEFEAHSKAPLLFHAGAYSESRARPKGINAASMVELAEHAGFIVHHTQDAAALEADLERRFSADEIENAKAVLNHLIAQVAAQKGD